MSFSARLGAIALAVLSCLLSTPSRAVCNAIDLASFQNCVATITAGDSLTLGANIDITGAGFGATPNDFFLVNGAFMLTGSGTLPKSGPGNVTLTGANGFAAGSILSITQGTVSINMAAAVPPGRIIIDGGSKLVALSTLSLPAIIEFGTSGTNILAAATAQALVLSGPVFAANANIQLNDPVHDGSILFAGVSGSTSGATILTVNSGIAEDTGATLLSFITGNSASTTVLPGALLRYTGLPLANIANLQGGGNVTLTGGGTLEVYRGNFGGQISAPVLDKVTSGVLRLSGTSSPTTVTVSAGSLVVDGTLNAPTSVAAGATLRGSGTIGGTVSLPTGAVLAPGANTAGAVANLTLQGVTLAGGQYIVDIAGPFAYDRVISNMLVTGSSATLNLGVVAPGLPPGTVVTVLTNPGSFSPLPFTFTGRPEGSLLTGGGQTFRLTYAGGDGNDVMLTVLSVPAAPTLVSATPGNGTVTVAFTANGDGGSPILDYTATCGPAPSVTAATSPIVITGLPNGIPAACVVVARNVVGNSLPSNVISATPVQLSFTGPSATGSGMITAVLSGGGPACSFAPTPSFIPVSAVATPPPAGVTFPHGLFDFTLSGCTPGSTATLAITYPTPVAGSRYWKFGPTPSDPAPHWYILASSVGGSVVTFSIVDGGLGDDDLIANGTIVDQGGPGIGPPGTAVPTSSEWMLMMLAALMVAAAAARRRRPRE